MELCKRGEWLKEATGFHAVAVRSANFFFRTESIVERAARLPALAASVSCYVAAES